MCDFLLKSFSSRGNFGEIYIRTFCFLQDFVYNISKKYKSNNLVIVENAPFDNILSYKPSASSLAMHCKGQSYASKNDVYKISTA